MKLKYFLFIIMLFGGMMQLQAANSVDMAFDLRASGKIYVVVLVVLVIFFGIALYLFLLDKKISKLEEEFNKREV
ncbi:MAG TPA: CcmD family protein [Sphingobacterium sp.]|nr:CcmD family protein [Sphingobacterium sp.]